MQNMQGIALVTGAAGSIGGALVRKLLSAGRVVRALDQDEEGLVALERSIEISNLDASNLRCLLGSIRDRGRLEMAAEGAETIFHCAALKHVSVSEYNPWETIETNIIGTGNVLKAAKATGVSKVVTTSSDKAVNPTSTMGTSKLMAEKLAVTANGIFGFNTPRSSVVRFGNVLNSSGSVLKVFRQRFESGLPLPITSPQMTRFFITEEKAVELCLFAEVEMLGGEIFVGDMGSVDLLTFARAVTHQDYPLDITGIKVGEKLFEELVTESEAPRTVAMNDVLVVLPESLQLFPSHVREGYERYTSMPLIERPIRSDSQIMDVASLRRLLALV